MATIGKTSSSISKAEVFNHFKEADILAAVMPEVTELPAKIVSPFREDVHPSFSFFLGDNNHIYYKDFGTGEKGSLLDFLCRYWKCNFNQALDKICELPIVKESTGIRPKNLVTLTRKEAKELTKIQVVVRPWREYDLEYWRSYGVEKQWLKHADVYPISHKIVTKKEKVSDKSKRYIFPADKYAYCFVEKKEGNLSLKIYQPFNKNGYKWCSKMDGSVIGLWTKIPQFGDRVVICSSLKDALCLSCQCHIPAICLQGEGYGISETATNELKRRFDNVYICFDVDVPGLENGEKLAQKTGFKNIVPDLAGEKDISDYYKSLTNKEEFKKLKNYFI